ncbi:hypothetical protein J2P12_04230 [Candidatus Bathyarchaeota archaeon]|nr:hypothetical protein [Candidatus Bathyarchaeota archaeon]
MLPTTQTSDFVWTWNGDCIITERVLQLFKTSSLTGFEANLIPVKKVKGRRRSSEDALPKLWELEILGKGGDAHPDSGIRLLYNCPECGYKRYSSFQDGIIVDPGNWDGSDFFTVTGYPKFIMITEKVKDLVVANKLTNCSMLSTEDLRWGNFPRPEDHPENFVPTKVTIKS